MNIETRRHWLIPRGRIWIMNTKSVNPEIWNGFTVLIHPLDEAFYVDNPEELEKMVLLKIGEMEKPHD